MAAKLLLIIFIKVISLMAQSCPNKQETFFTRIDKKSLNVTASDVLSIKTVEVPEVCLGVCRTLEFCRSINIERADSLFICRFLRVDRWVPGKQLKNSLEDVYFEIKTPCATVFFVKHVSNARDCVDIYETGFKRNGIYGIVINGKNVMVRCEMTTPPFGWTIFQKRFDGSTEFYRKWKEYKYGFGHLNEEFWLGNESLYFLTKYQQNKLHIKLKLNATEKYFEYEKFNISNEAAKYRLFVDKSVPQGEDNGFLYHNGFNFSTFDQDNDGKSDNCAEVTVGGWWYGGNACHFSNLNGRYYSSGKRANDEKPNGIHWRGSGYGPIDSYLDTEMMVRRIA